MFNVYNDFIFVIIGEELGFVGVFGLLGLFGLFVYIGMCIVSWFVDLFLWLLIVIMILWVLG